jgi:acetyl-CoA C-acetyltransferase
VSPPGPAPVLGALDPRLPVLVGVGTASGDAEATELMARALRTAVDDAGASSIAASIDRIAVPQGTWGYRDPGRLVAAGVGAPEARTHLVELGIPQQSLINDALRAVLTGESEVAVVVGGEAKRWARERERQGKPAETAQDDVEPDVVRRRPGPLLEPVEVAHRLWDPVLQYAMIENALRAADRQGVAEHAREVAELWASFNRVARSNPEAAFREPMDAEQIATPSPANRPLAFPYNRWHASQWTVDQAAALVLCSVAAARDHGVPTDRWLFPLVGIESSHAVSLLRRSRLGAWPAMGILGGAAQRRIARPLDEAEVIELYSCFPSAVRVQRRELGLDESAIPTVTGGMAFAGGPFNNFVLQATAAVARRLRAEPRALGAVTTVSGLLTKPGIGIWSATPDGRPPLLNDLAAEAEAATEEVDVVETMDGYTGRGTVATYTVTYDGLDPARVLVLCDTEDGRRSLVCSEDPELARHAVGSELVGATGDVVGGSFRLDSSP